MGVIIMKILAFKFFRTACRQLRGSHYGFKASLLLCWMIPAWVQAAPQLVDIRYNDLVTNQLQVELIFDEAIGKPDSSLELDPSRLVLMFEGASPALELNRIPVDKAGVKSIEAAIVNQGLQIEMIFDHMLEYQQQVQGNRFVVLLGDKARSVPVLTAVDGAGEAVATNPLMNRLTDIDFRLKESKQGLLKLDFHNSSLVADVKQRANKLEIRLFGTEISDEQLYTMDVMDFDTPVRSFETFRDDDGTRIVLDTHKDFQYEYQQQGASFELLVFEPAQITRQKEKVTYEGKKISLNFQRIPVRTVLQIIADYNNFNLVTGDSVGGEITLRLEEVPWDQALDIILKLKGLDKRIDGNILLVAPASELALREAEELKTNQEVEQLAPLYSEFLQINYAKAKDIAELLKSGETSMLSARGAVAVDERTNTLLLQDTAAKIDDVRRLIEVLDIPVRQVVIESRVVTVRDQITEEMGIRWGITDTISDGAVSGTLAGASTAAGGAVPNLTDQLNVNLPVTDPAGTIGFQVAKLADGTILDLELSALERENKGEIIARPSITTGNQKPAYIHQGTEIPYVQATSSGATSVSFKKAVLGLKVTPHITPDNRIILDLVITQNARGETVPTSTGDAVAIDTQEIGTQVLVNNGSTVVLGGIYQQQLINTVTKVPVLGDVPLVGWMFRQDSDITERRELLIFVTPRIITEEN